MNKFKKRRNLIGCLAALPVLGGAKVLAASPASTGAIDALPLPNPSTFKSGDLIWPKKIGQYVPYSSGSNRSYSEDRSSWLAEKSSYISSARNFSVDELDRKRIKILSNLDFREFLVIYQGGGLKTEGELSGAGFYVGHVAIIERDKQDEIWVIEALMERGVIRQTYKQWLESRIDQAVWHGRIKSLPEGYGSKVAEEAKKHLGTKYDFWNFDLDNEDGMYCSKLVWLSIKRSLGYAIDGNEDSKRILWLSPKQILQAPLIHRLHNPAPYGIA